MPSAFASRGFVIVTGLPLARICPASGCLAPESARISDVFPAPLPPTRPTTSPGYRSTVTPFTARTPPKETWMSRISTSATRCEGTTGVSRDPLTAMWSGRPATAHEGVQADGSDEHDPDDDVLRRRIDEQQDHPRTQ